MTQTEKPIEAQGGDDQNRRSASCQACARVQSALREIGVVVIIEAFHTLPALRFRSVVIPPQSARCEQSSQPAARVSKRGQVAQVVERSPEKAGVGGSTPSLATILFNGLADQPEISHL